MTQWDREELALSRGVRLVLREASSYSILNHGCACACMSSLPWVCARACLWVVLVICARKVPWEADTKLEVGMEEG